VGRRGLLHDLSRRSHAEKKPAAGNEQLFCHEHRERSAHRATNDAEALTPVLELVKAGVVARPARRGASLLGLMEGADNVAIRIEDADLRHLDARQIFLAARLTQQISRLEHGWCGE